LAATARLVSATFGYYNSPIVLLLAYGEYIS